MAGIRKNTIKSSIWIYLGFVIGAINVYFLTYNAWFTPEQYGLMTTMRELSMLFAAMSTVGTTTYLVKLFPYYKGRLPFNENDILGHALKIALIGFVVVASGLFLLKPLVIKVFARNAPLLLEYFYWCIPFAFFSLLFLLLESYSLGYHRGVLINFLKEFGIRVYVFVLIILKITGVIDFEWFIRLLTLQFLVILLVLLGVLYRAKQITVVFKKSIVTKRYKKLINKMIFFTAFVAMVAIFRASIDNIIISSKLGLDMSGVSSFSSYLNALLQAPYRSILSISTPILVTAWKDKNLGEINRIYQRSSINLLAFALLVFFCIYMNYDVAIDFLNLNDAYHLGKPVFLILGIVSIIELGFGLNANIIGTSSYWSFLLWANLLMALLLFPLGYIFTSFWGIIGPSLANLITFLGLNLFYFIFLYKKFNLQPFSRKTLEVIVGAFLLYLLVGWMLKGCSGLLFMCLSTFAYLFVFIIFLYWRNISVDFNAMVNKYKNKMRKS